MISPQIIPRRATMEARLYEDRLQNAWDDYVHRHPRSSLFHLTAWKRVVEKAFGFESRYLVVEDEGGIRGVLPLFLVHNIIQGRSLISTPFAVYGGICSSDEEAADALREGACQMARKDEVQYLELREQWPRTDPHFQTKQLYVTFDQDLPQDPDGLLRGFPRDTRYMIRKAQKEDLRAVVDNQQLNTFYEIYARSVHHLGTPVFSKTFFEILLEEFRHQAEITSVWNRTRCIAAVLSFRFRDWILPYYGGSLLEGRHLAANNFMYWQVMKRAVEKGIRHFDFGRSKMGAGSYAFKKQWNMRERPLPYQFYLVRRKSMPNFSPANPQFRLVVSLWKRMPFQVTKTLGPPLVRLFP